MKPDTMASSSMQPGITSRKRWMSVLAYAGSARLAEALARLAPPPSFEHVRPPEVGMVMVRGRADGNGGRFNLGEMTMTRCTVALPDGFIGHGYVTGRDKAHAELAAVFDALLQDPGRNPGLMDSVIIPLEREQLAARRAQNEKTAATRVNFFTMVRGED
ncbi:phosphonate C-P lyase system protein PhnG [Pseudodesulfovibrio sp. F-1]|uniref:Phosphonate C-P lyase system protein PhnG n=1 Tax=Pseudodesulfovibrio alkaliphilus TaxID=2661613 RepID=A0A7K1KRX5_9BACT|nr:phosphonate C-P lyase system protein PhnG [Pseudodesulfovibrio alkaliphilus]MUM78849.1 phosphonate C-P lyase system protein PhnG [Pseudodesulfovibrio alkaliphilus]